MTSTAPSSPVGVEPAELALDDPAGRGAGEDVGLAEKFGEPAGLRALVDLFRRADLQHAAAAHHGDGVGERQRLGLVVRHQQCALTGVFEDAPDLLTQRLAEVGIERGEGLVEQHDLRIAGEGAGERDPLALAARQLMGERARAVRQSDKLQAFRDALATRGTEGDVGLHREVGNSAPSWNTIPTRRCSGSTHVPAPATRRSPIAIRPASGTSKPAIIRSSVVFPEPLGPSSATRCPSSTAMDASATAGVAPNDSATATASMARSGRLTRRYKVALMASRWSLSGSGSSPQRSR